MSLVSCPECQKQIAEQSEHCVGCGYKPQMTQADIALTAIAANIKSIWNIILIYFILSLIVGMIFFMVITAKR